jgi:hypothetical protein
MKSFYSKVLKKMKYTINLFIMIAIGCIAMFASCEDEKSGSSDLAVDKTDIEVSSIGGMTLISVNTDLTWTASANANWVNLEPASGNGSGAITVKFDSCTGPRRTAEIIVYSGSFTKTVNVLQRGNQKEDYWKTGDVIALHRHILGNGVAVVILGDGFDREDCRKGGVYEYNCQKLANLFLSMPVIRDLTDYIDVFARVDVSRERGVRNCVINEEEVNCTDNAYGAGGIWYRWDKAMENATLAAGKDDRSIIFMGNGPIGGFVNEHGIAIYSADEPNKPYWMMHEFCGHVLGAFPDLYYNEGNELDEGAKRVLDEGHRNGDYLMLDYNRDPETVYWKDFINKDGYTNIGIFPAPLWNWLLVGEVVSCEAITSSVMYGPVAHYTVMERYQLWRKILTRAGVTAVGIGDFKEYDKENKFDDDFSWDRYEDWHDDRIWNY